MDTIKQIGIRILIGLVLFVIVIMGIFSGLSSMVTTSASGSSTYSGDVTDFSDLGNYIIKTDESGAMPAMTKEQLRKAIESCYSGQTALNLISTLNDFISVQDKYKINAAFMVAITIIESSGGTAWDAIDPDTHNWMSVSWGEKWNGAEGKTQPTGTHVWCWYSSFSEAVQKFGIYLSQHDWAYFTAGKYSVSEIAPTYCNAQWGTSIEKELDKLYSAAGVSSGVHGSGTTGVDGNSRTTYTYAGKTYIVYAQGDSEYNWVSYADGNIGDSGCGPTSVAICVSAYDKSVTPKTVVSRCESLYGNTVWPGTYSYTGSNSVFNKYLEEYGLTCTGYEVSGAGRSFNDEDANRIINHLKSGQPIILNYQGMLQLNAGNGFNSGPGHFVTLLGLDNNNNIYVGNPAGGCSGYTSMTNIKQTPEIRRYYLVTKK